MFKQYFKQAIQMLKENRLTSVISILGTALSIAMILVVILQFQIKLVGFRPESNRGRMLYIMGIRADSRNSGDRNSTAMSDGVVKECLYPLQTPEAVTAIASNRAIVSLPNRQLFEEYVIKLPIPVSGRSLIFASFPANRLRRRISVQACLVRSLQIRWLVSFSSRKTRSGKRC